MEVPRMNMFANRAYDLQTAYLNQIYLSNDETIKKIPNCEVKLNLLKFNAKKALYERFCMKKRSKLVNPFGIYERWVFFCLNIHKHVDPVTPLVVGIKN